MTKAELITRVQEVNSDLCLPRTSVNTLCDSLFAELAKGIKKDKRFTYPDFGTWTLKKRKARNGRNPQTGAMMKIAASKTIGFKPSPSLKTSL